MCKVVILFIMLFLVITFCSGKRRKKENVKDQSITQWSDHLKFYSNLSIDVRLYEIPTTWISQDEAENNTRSFTGIIEVVMPQALDTQFLCFPHSSAEFFQAYLFAQITCRKLGFMTLVTISGFEFPHLLTGTIYHGIKLDTYSCFGGEQNISRCRWNAVSIKSCQNFTKVTCGGCQNVAKGFGGVIRSPGFPYVHLNDVTCEWRVMVPVKHSILLLFDHFDELSEELTTLPCGVDQPYVEIMYGIQSKVTVHRFCRFKEVTNMSIPFHTVKIVIFTGISSSREKILNEKRGFSITFQAIPEEEEISSPLKMVLLSLLGLIFLSCTVTCRYIKKHKICDCGLQKASKPDEEVDKIQDYRCEHNVPENDIEVNRKGSNATGGFYYNTPKLDKVSCKKHSSLEIPKPFTHIAVQSFSDGKKTEGAGWRAETKTLQRYSTREDPNRLSVATPLLYEPVSRNRNAPISKETAMQEHRKQNRDYRNEPLIDVVSSFFN